MNELAIVLQPNKEQFLYLQIYEYITNEIKMRKLLAGEKLPSTRFLAQYLQVSRSTVELAYEQLVAEGYIESKPYKGYYVNHIEHLARMESISHLPRRNSESNPAKEEDHIVYEYDFSPNKVEMQGFPFSVWKKIQKEALAENEYKLFALGEPRGEEALRAAIAHYLHGSRGVICEKEQIIIGAGNDYLLMLLEKILGEEQVVAIENPTYQRVYHIFHSFGYKVHSIELDGQGIQIKPLCESNATIAYVMPAHQFPTGQVMPIARRLELLGWAGSSTNRYIIEDDYDSEFRYKGRPVKSLQSLDECGSVIYMGTFSKAIAPAIRISYMVLPKRLLEKYEKQAYFYSSTVSIIDQTTLELFIREGYFERHLNKMRKRYKEKHDLLLALLKEYEPLITVEGENLGLHLILTYHGDKSQEQVLEEAQSAKVKVYPMSAYWNKMEQDENACIQILIGYASVELEDIRKGMTRLLQVWSLSNCK